MCATPDGRNGHGRPHWATLISTIHHLERAVIYRNPTTGEIRTPPRADQDMPDSYKAAGFIREEIDTHQKRREFEQETGKIMEAAYYDNGSATAEREADALSGPVLDGSCVGAPDAHNQLTLKDLRDAGLQD
jgi:hypothetical protein